MKVSLAFGVAALLALSLSAHADIAEPDRNDDDDASFAELDKNADLRISRTEASMNRQLINQFAYIDADGDGYISPDEFRARKEVTASIR
jgi:Ca2+-binding EF-hand superfamily protein